VFWIYLAATLFGGAFLIPMLLGGLDVEMDAELEFDADVEVDLDADTGDAADGWFGDGAAGAIVGSLLSFRTAVFLSVFFGASGLVFSAFDYSVVVTLLSAIFIGVMAASMNSVIFGWLKHSQPNSQISDQVLEGRPARVVVPLGSGRKGQIRVDLNGQPQYLVALPYQSEGGPEFDVGASVVVVQIENGTALVASLAELDLGEEQ